MPTYEYECRACSQRVEVFQKITDAPLTDCEECGGSLRKVIFPTGIIFKGSGFYVTDYKNKENGKNGSRNGSSAGETKSTPSSDTASTGSTGTTEKKETTTTAKSD
jgi:putative FmdB family regulatory protein